MRRSPSTAPPSASSPILLESRRPGRGPTAGGTTEEAIAEERTAIRLLPSYSRAHAQLGSLLKDIKGGDRREARRRDSARPSDFSPTMRTTM